MLRPPVRNRNLRRPHNRMPAPCKAQWPAACSSSNCCRRSRWCFPDLATDRGPLDSWGKFKLAANNSIALSTIGAALVGSAYGQAISSPAGYGQGGAGYGKRFGADMARAASANMFGTFLVASLTHQDPRFYVQKHLNFKESVTYAPRRGW